MQRENNLQNGKGKTETAIKVLLLIIVIAAALPFFGAIRYTIFHGDDFAFYLSTAACSGKTWFAKAMRNSWDTYMTWQGTYMTNIANTLCNPLRTYSWTALKLTLLGCAGMMLASALWLSYETDLTFDLGGKTAYIFALLVFPILIYRDYGGVYLEFICCMAYELPMLFLCTGLALTLRSRRTGSKPLAAAAGVFLFLMAGGVLLIGALGACLMLLLLITDWIENGKPNKIYVSLFAVTVISDLINTLAPGNYAKHDLIGELRPFASVAASLKTAASEFAFLAGHFSFAGFIVLAFLLGWNVGKSQKKAGFAAAMAILAVMPAVTLFPMMLGYSGNGLADVPSRGLFVLDISLIVSAETIAVLVGGQLRAAAGEKAARQVRLGAALASAGLMLLSLLSLRECMPVKITENLINGKIPAYGRVWHERYDDMAARPGEDIVIIDFPEGCEGTLGDPLFAHPDTVVNMDMAEYFGNNSICSGYHEAMMNGMPEGD